LASFVDVERVLAGTLWRHLDQPKGADSTSAWLGDANTSHSRDRESNKALNNEIVSFVFVFVSFFYFSGTHLVLP
jgi:hypothetical protein